MVAAAHLAGSSHRTCNSWSQGHEFELQVGCRDYLKNMVAAAAGWRVDYRRQGWGLGRFV